MIQLASLFQDGAVLQRDQTLPVWGWTQPKTKVRARIGTSEAFAYSSELGHFELRLPAMPAGGPHWLRVENIETGESIEVRELLIGEVWIASGQSNMDWKMRSCGEQVAADAAAADFPQLRFFTVQEQAALGRHPLADGAWQAVTPESVLDCSAVAFSFGRALLRELGVPVGLIVSARGGSIIESWTSRLGLLRNPDTSEACERYDIACHSPERWAKAEAAGDRYTLFPEDPGNAAFAQGWGEPDFDDSAWKPIDIPNTWQSQGYAHSGVFWFRRTVEIPTAWAGKALTLKLGALDKQDVAYVNGIEVGRTGSGLESHHWTVPRSYTVPAERVQAGAMVIAVRVYSFAWDGGMLGPASVMSLHPEGESAPEQALPLAGEWRMAMEHDLGLVETCSEPGHGEFNSPHMLFDNMVQPLIPYAIRGAIWYQGESNVHQSFRYESRLKSLIQDWRYQWGQGDFPFHLVQLPNYLGAEGYEGNSQWAALRAAQLKALELPRTGIAITLGLGEADDIHPSDKMPVGERLAQSALVDVYGRCGEPCGPIYSDCLIENGQIICTFLHAVEGLATMDGQEVKGVYIAGTDRAFKPADASICGSQLVCKHPDISDPVSVRYAWANNPTEFNLCNAAGQPASPFCTDTDTV